MDIIGDTTEHGRHSERAHMTFSLTILCQDLEDDAVSMAASRCQHRHNVTVRFYSNLFDLDLFKKCNQNRLNIKVDMLLNH